MQILIPDKKLLSRTNNIDYYYWNYKFPIKYVQLYRFKTIVKLLGGKKYPRLLEAGTGSGIFLPELALHCEKLYACDKHSNFGNIENLLMHFKINKCELKSQNIQKTDYPDNYFDAVVAVSVLEFVDDLQKTLDEIKRILKKDGEFLTICPMQNKFIDSILSLYSDKNPEEEFGQTREYVTKVLEKNFRILKKGHLTPIIGKYFPI